MCRAQKETCKTVDKSCMLLVDSGGQYDCGTTDITRTFHFGEPTQHQKDCYTRVLQVPPSPLVPSDAWTTGTLSASRGVGPRREPWVVITAA